MMPPGYSNGQPPTLQPPFNPDVAMGRAAGSKAGVRKDSGFGEKPKNLVRDTQQSDDDDSMTRSHNEPVENTTNQARAPKLYHCQPGQGHSDVHTLQSSSSLPDATCSRHSSTSSRPLNGSTRSYRSRSSSKRSPNSLRRIGTNDLTPPGARPHRMRSNPTMPLPHMNIEEAIALHQRSCALFRTPTGGSFTTSSPISIPPPLQRSYTTTCAPLSSHTHTLEHEFSAPTLRGQFTQSEDEDEEIETPYEPYPATVTHWTSNQTRRREYAEIDRRRKGLKGLLRKLVPNWCHRSTDRTEFYNEQNTKREGSVRRYRMDLPPEDDDDGQEDVVDEKAGVVRRGSEEVTEISISGGSART